MSSDQHMEHELDEPNLGGESRARFDNEQTETHEDEPVLVNDIVEEPVAKSSGPLSKMIGPMPLYAWIALLATAGVAGYAVMGMGAKPQPAAQQAVAFTPAAMSAPVTHPVPVTPPTLALGSKPDVAPMTMPTDIKPEVSKPAASADDVAALGKQITTDTDKINQRLDQMSENILALQKQVVRINGEIAVLASPAVAAKPEAKVNASGAKAGEKVFKVHYLKGWSVKSATTGGSALIVDRHGVTHMVEAGDRVDGILIRFVGESHVSTSAGMIRFQ